MYRLKIHDKAQLDAERIAKYIKFSLLNSKAAKDFTNILYRRYITICKNPHLFPSEYIDGRLYKKAMVKKYIVLFRIDENTQTIHIIAIGHSLQKRRNIVKNK